MKFYQFYQELKQKPLDNMFPSDPDSIENKPLKSDQRAKSSET